MNTQAAMLDMEEEGKSLRDYFNILRRRKHIAAIAAAAVMVVVVLVTFLWPPTYRSQSIILIEQQDIPSDLVRTTITSYAQQRIEEIKQRIMTIGNIMSIVEEFGLYTDRELERMTRTEIAEEFRDAVSIRPISAEVVDPRSGRPSMAVIAFSLAFDGDAPTKVQKVTNEITTLYLDENLKERTEQTRSTSEFLTTEAKTLSTQLETLDADIATFKEENNEALPELNQFNMNVVDRTEQQINELSYQIKELEKRKIQLEGDLTQLSPTAPVVLASGQTVLGDADRLKALQSQLRQAEATYSDDHPDIQRLRREVRAIFDSAGSQGQYEAITEQLRMQRDMLADLNGKYTDGHPEIIKARRIIAGLESDLARAIEDEAEVKPDNPAYLVLKTRLDATNEDIRASKSKIEELRVKVERYENNLSRSPQVEKAYQKLLRDYQNTYSKYQEIRAKQMSAELAQNLESERKGERFTLIQPPELPIDPVSPNRFALIIAGFFVAIGAGLGLAVLVEAMDDGIYSVSEVVSVTGESPLVSIGYMETAEEAVVHNKKRMLIILGLVVIGVVALMLFHYFIKPLDVTWYILQRKLGF